MIQIIELLDNALLTSSLELLNTHNAEYDYWNSLTEAQKSDAIAFAK